MTGIEFRIAGVVVKKKEEVLMARQMDGAVSINNFHNEGGL